jgi:hypothetical protein
VAHTPLECGDSSPLFAFVAAQLAENQESEHQDQADASQEELCR